MAPLNIQFENLLPGFVITSVTGEFFEGSPPTPDTDGIVDFDQELTVRLTIDTSASHANTLSSLADAHWQGKAVLHAVETGGTTQEISIDKVLTSSSAEVIDFVFPAKTVGVGMYHLYIRTGLFEKSTGKNLGANLKSMGCLVLYFNAANPG